MVRRVNIVEAAAQIAEERVKEIFQENNKSKTEKEIHNLIWVEYGIDMAYTDEAQELFNKLYDNYFEILESCVS